jgi:hypothetical protein
MNHPYLREDDIVARYLYRFGEGRFGVGTSVLFQRNGEQAPKGWSCRGMRKANHKHLDGGW